MTSSTGKRIETAKHVYDVDISNIAKSLNLPVINTGYKNKNEATEPEHEKPVTHADLNRVNTIMVGVIIAFFISFVALAITVTLSYKDSMEEKEQALKEKTDSYNQLRDKLDNQNAEIDDLRIDQVQTRNDLHNAIDKKQDLLTP